MLSGPFRLPSVSLSRLTQQIPSAHVLRISTEDDRKVYFRLWMLHHQQTDTHVLGLPLLLSQNAPLLESRASYGNWPAGLVCPWRRGGST